MSNITGNAVFILFVFSHTILLKGVDIVKKIITIIIMIICISINAEAHNDVVCYSAENSNEIEYCGFDFMSEDSLDDSYKNRQIWVPGICVSQLNDEVTVSYGYVPGASGYEIKYSDTIDYKVDAKIKDGKTISTDKNTYVIKMNTNNKAYIQVRPYKILDVKTYGKWSSVFSASIVKRTSSIVKDNEYGTVCYSKKDSNKQKPQCIKYLSSKKMSKMYADKKIWTTGIEVIQTGKKLKIKYKKTPGADGYVVKYSDCLRKGKLIKPSEFYTKKRSINIDTGFYEPVFIKVRPYMTVKGKKIFGKWSSVYAYGDLISFSRR